nr:MAG: replication associated protein [Cressdnaviricota sp.]
MTKTRGYCLTINNYDDDMIADWMYHTLESVYSIVGFEIAPDTGTPHMQCYVFWDNAISFNTMKKRFPTAHIEAAKGDPKSNQKYCSEDGDYYETGTLPIKGKRTDIDELISALDQGKTKREIKALFPKQYFMYNKKIDEYIEVSANINTQFYVFNSKHADTVNNIHEHFADRIVFINELSQITAYDEYDTVVFTDMKNDYNEYEYNMWSRGKDILYKYGYQWKKLKCKHFVLVTESKELIDKLVQYIELNPY